ncbi:Kappa-type opioid receptor [Mizuhopecten yessoensis]|uniref:Kappa-type opioid receptor n=1 Tax=Mizuhopecten yessoensis TaxID=6573 RepID=A0A210Q044_MIZYE|nr:Kappa-type opioid receptor [Mizuhopecten yessoensis]
MEHQTVSFDNQTVGIFNTTKWNSTAAPDQSDHYEPSILELYVSPTIAALGLVGNSLLFIVLMQLSKDSSFYLYLAVLALSDSVALLLGGIIRWLNTIGLVKLSSSLAQSYCSPIFVCVVIAGQFASWTIVAVSFDRYIAVCHPFKVAKYCTKKRAIIILTCTFLAICVINSPMLCFEWYDDNSCVFTKITLDFCLKYLNNVDPPVHAHVPILFVLVLNTLMIHRLIIAAKQRDTLSNFLESNCVKDSTRRTALLLLAITSIFVLTFLPLIGITTYLQITNKDMVAFSESHPLALHMIDVGKSSGINCPIFFVIVNFGDESIRNTINHLSLRKYSKFILNSFLFGGINIDVVVPVVIRT